MEERGVLGSWKEIASYLKRAIKTCQRWESEFGLPVHRLDGMHKGKVFAYRDEIDRWLRKRQHLDDEGESPQRSVRRLRTRGLAVLAAAAAILAGVIALKRSPAERISGSVRPFRPSVAVLDFDNPTGDELPGRWTSALADLMAEDLRQSNFLEVAPRNRTAGVLNGLEAGWADSSSSEGLARIAKTLAVGFIVRGRLFFSGGRFTANVSIENPHVGGERKAFSFTAGEEKNLFAEVDRLTKGIKIALNLSSRQKVRDPDKDVGSITTLSPEAFRLYSQGCRLSEREENDRAIDAFQRAVAIDPGFALAYRQLSEACLRSARASDSKVYRQKAFELSRRASERMRLLIEGEHYGESARTFDQSAFAYRKLLALHPDDDSAAIGLSRIHVRREEWDQAAPLLEKLVLRYEQDAVIHRDLADAYAAMGFPDRAERLSESFAGKFPARGLDAIRSAIQYAIIQRKFENALSHIRTYQSLTPGDPSAGIYTARVLLYRGNLAEAEKELLANIERTQGPDQLAGRNELGALYLLRGRFRAAMDQAEAGVALARTIGRSEWERPFHYRLAHLLWASGNREAALREADAACRGIEDGDDSRPTLEALLERALILLEMGRMDELNGQAEDLKRRAGISGDIRLMRFRDYLLARREFKKGNPRQAYVHAWKALDSAPRQSLGAAEENLFKYFDLIAEIDERERDTPSALSHSGRSALLTLGRAHSGDAFARSLFRAGRIHEHAINAGTGTEASESDRAHKKAAIENYRSFLELWKDADQIFPEVGEAKRRLRALETK